MQPQVWDQSLMTFVSVMRRVAIRGSRPGNHRRRTRPVPSRQHRGPTEWKVRVVLRHVDNRDTDNAFLGEWRKTGDSGQDFLVIRQCPRLGWYRFASFVTDRDRPA